MMAMILLCVAVIVLCATAGDPWRWIALALAVVALLVTVGVKL